jgi:multidrug efflux pump subunit AcrB
MVALNLDELYAKQLSPIDVSNALTLQNLILPAGTAKMAETEYQIRVNSSLGSSKLGSNRRPSGGDANSRLRLARRN